MASNPLSFGRIAKPLRGGGGGPATAVSVPQPIGGGAANPLTRLQAEETGGGKWFYLGWVGFSCGGDADVWIASSQTPVMVLQFPWVMDGWCSRLTHGVLLLYKRCSTGRSDSTIIVRRARTKRSAECEGETARIFSLIFSRIFCSVFHV